MTKEQIIQEIKDWLKEKDKAYKSAELWRRALIRKITKLLGDF